MLKTKHTYYKGFTLIELMVVVSIIIILLSFLVPKYEKYEAKAKNAKALYTAREIYEASMTSFVDQEGNFDEGEIKNSVKDITGISLDSVAVSDTKTQATIDFSCDNKKHEICIDSSLNNFTLDGTSE